MTNQKFTEQDAKLTISGIIREIWGDAVANNTPENMTQEVIDVVNDVISSIKTCSKRLLAVDITYNFLYTAPGTIWEVLFAMAADLIAQGMYDENHNPLATYTAWVNVLRGKREYKACVSTAALYNRSRLEMALMGI